MQDGWLCYQKYLLSKKKKKDYVWNKYCVHEGGLPFNIKSHKLNIT